MMSTVVMPGCTPKNCSSSAGLRSASRALSSAGRSALASAAARLPPAALAFGAVEDDVVDSVVMHAASVAVRTTVHNNLNELSVIVFMRDPLFHWCLLLFDAAEPRVV